MPSTLPPPAQNGKTASIYGLVDPRTHYVFYVGRTTMRLSQRLNAHIDKARRQKSQSPKSQRIRDLLRRGLRPEIVEIDSVPVDDAAQAEGEWIARYRAIGVPLTNVQSHNVGGLSRSIVDWTPETLAKLGQISDSDLAAELGVDRKTVEYHRQKHGIPRKPQTTFVVPQRGGWNRKELSPEILARLGTVPDHVLAAEAGVSKKVIVTARNARHIPSWADTHGNPSRFQKGQRPARWSKKKGGDA